MKPWTSGFVGWVERSYARPNMAWSGGVGSRKELDPTYEFADEVIE
jgi:hypothetical protein